MSAAPATHDEQSRIELLHALQLLDSPPEEVFDRVTRLAACILGAPIALISLIDRDRQWFKSCIGLGMREMSREQAFCAHAIRSELPLVVTDARADARFADNPLVLGEPHVRFYAGAPFFSRKGIVLGTLCVIGREPRVLSGAEVEALQDLAAMISREVAYRETTQLSKLVQETDHQVLAASEARFQATFEQAAVGIALAGLDGRWIRVNQKLCSIVGYSEAELVQLSFREITAPEDLQADAEPVAQMLRGEIEQYNMEKRCIRKDGERIWANLSVSLVRDDDGQPQYFVSVIEDIQARKDAERALQRLRRHLEERVEQRTRELQESNSMLRLAMEEQRRSERALRARKEQLRAVLENAQDAFVSIDEAGVITQWNRQAELTFGWDSAEAIGRYLDETIIPPSAREQHREGIRHFRETGETKVLNKRLELNAMRRDGSIFPAEVRISPLPSEAEVMFCAFLHDISERKQAEDALRASREQLQTIADNLPVQISYVDADLIVRFANESYRLDFGLAPEWAVGKPLDVVLSEVAYRGVLPHVERVLRGERVNFEMSTYDNGRERVWDTVYIPDVSDGKVMGFHVMGQDITRRKQLELSLLQEAERDALTGLPNRRALMQRLHTVQPAAGRAGRTFGVLFLDLDGFKAVNDRYGHDGGDLLLQQVARRLADAVRETDMVARLAGDEFVVVIEAVKGGEKAVRGVAEKILEALHAPFLVEGNACAIGASIGVYISEPGAEIGVEEILDRADEAMYEAKRAGKNRLHFAEPALRPAPGARAPKQSGVP